MRILFLCPQPLWPTNTGSRLRNFHLASQLTQAHAVTVLQLFPSGSELEEHAIKPFARVISVPRKPGYPLTRSLRGLLGPLPIPVLNYYSRAADQVLSDLIGQQAVDAVQLQGVHVFKYFETIKSASSGLPILVDWHNIESELMARYASQSTNLLRKVAAYRTAPLLRRLELQMLEQARVHTVVSEREKQILKEWAPDADVRVIANGVDTKSFRSAALEQFKSAGPDLAKTLLFVGSMDYHANIDAVIWFAQAIWPELSRQFPALHFTIAGRQPTSAVQALASDRIHVTGTVSDIREQYANAFAVVVPLRVGGGTRLKILEAMAAGVPVISTTLGAEGISVKQRETVLISDTPDDFRSAVDLLINHPHLRSELVRNARDLVINNYDWGALGAQLIEIYKQLE